MGMRWRMGGCGSRGFEGFPAFSMKLGPGIDWIGGFDPFGGRSGDWGGGGGRGRGGNRMFRRELRLVLLQLIADQPRHGYDLMRAVEELTGGRYVPSPGVVYPTLTMLQDMGLIEEQPAEGARRAFAATADGRAHLEERAEEVDVLFDRLREMAPDRHRHGGAPIRRAVGNLLSALWHRVTAEDMDEDRLHQIADILDDAARRIERLQRNRDAGEA